MNASSRPVCLPGTRRKILDEITDWLTVPSNSTNILWLSGVAGAGKSTISTTIAESFRGVHRLGAFIFFDRNDEARSHPDSVIRTIAYWLALSSPDIGSAISAAIQHDPAIVNAPLLTQFKALIFDPLLEAEPHITGPILVVLDALDECGDATTRSSLITLLSSEFPKLPPFLCIFITSRPDADITQKFEHQLKQRVLETGVVTSSKDVESFIRHELAHIRGLPIPAEENIKALVALSGGLFIWASTAMKFIAGYGPKRRLKLLLSQESSHEFNLDELYKVALQESAPWTDRGFAEDAQAVLECVVLGRVPMTDQTIDHIISSNKSIAADVLTHLGCVIQWSSGAKARTLHASFTDYLTDPGRSGKEPWGINPKSGHLRLSLACLQTLSRELKFNICRLADSHLLNVDVQDMSDRVARLVSPQLTYSSCFCFDHVQHTSADKTIIGLIRKLIYRKALYWLEVLSVLDQVQVATAALRIGASYVEVNNITTWA